MVLFLKNEGILSVFLSGRALEGRPASLADSVCHALATATEHDVLRLLGFLLVPENTHSANGLYTSFYLCLAEVSQ